MHDASETYPHQIIIDQTNAGRRLDTFIRKLCAQTPLGELMRMIRCGLVRVNGRKCPGGHRLQAHDTLHFRHLPAAPASCVAAPTRRRGVPALVPIFEDDHLLVVNKPAGLACHPGTGQRDDTLIARLLRHLPPGGVGQAPGLCQRLDAGVSGLLVIGKNTQILRALSAAVESGQISKRYVAVVSGQVTNRHGCVTAPLRVTDQPMGNRPRTLIDAVAGKPAITHYTRLARGVRHSVLCLRLQTGRTHQIRAHLRHLGHPLLGDARYGDAAHNAYAHQTFGLCHPALHAGLLRFVHPVGGALLTFAVPLPPILRRLSLCR